MSTKTKHPALAVMKKESAWLGNPPEPWYWPLWNYMNTVHKLPLMECEVLAICAAAHASEKRRAKELAPTLVKAVQKMAAEIVYGPPPASLIARRERRRRMIAHHVRFGAYKNRKARRKREGRRLLARLDQLSKNAKPAASKGFILYRARRTTRKASKP